MLSKSCEYGLRTAVHLACVEGPVGAYVPIRGISAALGLPYHFLAKIAQAMIQHGLLDSTRGPHGGIRLARPAARISLYDVVLALDGAALFEACVLGLPGCGSQRPCPLHDQWAPLRAHLRATFEDVSVATLAERMADGDFRLADLSA